MADLGPGILSEAEWARFHGHLREILGPDILMGTFSPPEPTDNERLEARANLLTQAILDRNRSIDRSLLQLERDIDELLSIREVQARTHPDHLPRRNMASRPISQPNRYPEDDPRYHRTNRRLLDIYSNSYETS